MEQTKKDLLALLSGTTPKQIIPIKLVLDTNDEEFDIPCTMEVQGADEHKELLICPQIVTNEIDETEKIHHYLNEDDFNLDNIKIEIDIKDGIFIYDKEDNLLREIEFKQGFTQNRDVRVKEILLKLLSIL